MQWKEADLRVRLTQLDYDLKPENIERYFAGFGSTRPEELREQRRVQLQGEKDAIVAQIKSLDESKVRLRIGDPEGRLSRLSTERCESGQSHGHSSLAFPQGFGPGGGVVLFGLVGLCSLL